MRGFQLARIITTGVTMAVVMTAPAPAAAAGTPAERQIEAARARLETGTPAAKDYNALAAGFTRRARETGDTAWYDQALAALDKALAIDPGNVEAVRTSAWVRMGRHEFDAARVITQRYGRAHRDDASNLGVMGDALMELGRYSEAEEAYQRMVDLRPGPASYSRAAYAREVRGDVAGAQDLMLMALDATDRREIEDRAWLLVQAGHLRDMSGDLSGAESSCRQALALFPGYHYALAALAELCLRSGRAVEAAALAGQAIQAAPHAERYLLLADALRALGRDGEARAAEDRFEELALGNQLKHDNENHDLVLFYLERRPDVARALAIAQREARVRQDVQTLDRLAIARYRSGEVHMARWLMRRVLATGTRDPLIQKHAAEVED